MENNSRKHHYIPVFLQKAFTNDNGFLYIYDKETDKIIPSPRHPNSIFYEDYANSITSGMKSFPLIENIYSDNKIKGMDMSASLYIKKLQKEMTTTESLDAESIALVTFFVSQLTWRVPSNTRQVTESIEIISKHDPLFYNFLKKFDFLSEEDQFKIARFFTPAMFIKEGRKILSNRDDYFAVVKFPIPIFCISDNPVVWSKFPISHEDLFNQFIFPISKDKLLISCLSRKYNFTNESLKMLVFILFDQAKRYVGFHSKDILYEYVDAYRVFRQASLKIQDAKNMLFREINL